MSYSSMRDFWAEQLKCAVIRNFEGDYDDEATEPVAVMLGMQGMRVVFAPCTVLPDEAKTVAHGSVLLTRQSPAYTETGFMAAKIAISVREAGTFSFDSTRVKKAVQAGILYPRRDKKLSKKLDHWLEIYHLTAIRERFML